MKTLEELSDKLQEQAEEIREVFTAEEINTWKRHPCTLYILKRLEAEYLDNHISWESGAFTEETLAGTQQRNATALGAIGALMHIKDDIESMCIDED